VTEAQLGSGQAKTPLGPGYWRLWFASVVSNLGDGLSVVAYPWLASALTRNPVAIAGVLIATRLPWLVFTLPAGVITDRVDRRRLVLGMDVSRFVLTLGVAVVIVVGEGSLNDPTDIADGLASPPGNAAAALGLLYVAALLLGSAEVLRDNAAQTLMPSLVERENLERANGRLWGAEVVMNAFVGPPLAGFLLAVSFALPFFIDAGTFAVAAALIFLIAGDFRPKGRASSAPTDFRGELKEGFSWLWGHPFLRGLAIALGFLNGLSAATQAAQVLFAQEVLGLGAAGFGALGIAGAVGGVLGSLTAERFTNRFGHANSLFATILLSAMAPALIGALPSVPLVFSMFALVAYIGTIWNVITVAMRQSLIPDSLLGRVNSVYRFFGWGMIPIGGLIGGLIIMAVDTGASRTVALRMPFALSAVGHLLLFVWAIPRLNQARIDEVMETGVAAKEAADANADVVDAGVD
jgi:MFS family permease